MTAMPQKYQPLLIALASLVVLPGLMLAVGLTLTTATDVVIFAIACMGLNILVGHTGLGKADPQAIEWDRDGLGLRFVGPCDHCGHDVRHLLRCLRRSEPRVGRGLSRNVGRW